MHPQVGLLLKVAKTGLVGQLSLSSPSKAGWQLKQAQCAEAEKMAEEVALLTTLDFPAFSLLFML